MTSTATAGEGILQLALRTGLIAIAALFTSSAAPQPPTDPIADLIEAKKPELPPAPQFTGAFAAYVKALHETSCPANLKAEDSRPLALRAKPISLQAINPSRKTVGALTYVGGFHLTTDDPGFGGWSGLETLDDGRLLAVSDTGHYLWINLAADGFTPTSASIGEIRDNAGKLFATKVAGDAEDIAMLDGLALIAFEGDARVMAYDVTRCGQSARAASLGWTMRSAFRAAGIQVDPNLGVEGLAITDDGFLIAGIETQVGGESPLSIRPLEARPDFKFRIGKNSPELVALDTVAQGDDIRLFSLHRSSKSPMSSNAITFIETVLTRDPNPSGKRADQTFSIKSSLLLAEMNLLLTIDNFEGLAARRMPDGRIRLHVLSDNNYSGSQRTLLMTFDLLSK